MIHIALCYSFSQQTISWTSNNSYVSIVIKWKNDNRIDQLLDYVATHSNDEIIYRKSSINLVAHSDAVYLNENQERSWASTHIYLLNDVHIPAFNGAVINIAQIIKYVISSAVESELASLFITARKWIEKS